MFVSTISGLLENVTHLFDSLFLVLFSFSSPLTHYRSCFSLVQVMWWYLECRRRCVGVAAMDQSDLSRFGDCDGVTKCHDRSIDVASQCLALYARLYQYPLYDLYVLVHGRDWIHGRDAYILFDPDHELLGGRKTRRIQWTTDDRWYLRLLLAPGRVFRRLFGDGLGGDDWCLI